ncbi:MAG TPA: DUF2332 domain-containing protein, partial [Acidimicrobiales bacterium]|nr:DUF2332 domain-containing protein [Acidimicrobiales bacterium]
MTSSDAGELDAIRRRFTLFEESFADLALYGRLARGCATDPDVASMLCAAQPGQQRPVLLFAAVHDLILRRPDLELARWYSSVTPSEQLASSDPWPVFRRTVLGHRRDLEAVIASHSTQTNEVNRSVLVAVLLCAACADLAGSPVRLVELGTSAGLLLTPDRYRIEVGDTTAGDVGSSVHLRGEMHGVRRPDLSTFPRVFVDRIGIDRDPVPVTDPDRIRWLEACLWPDQPWRIERFRAAVAVARTDPPRLVAGDMIDELADVVRGASGARTSVGPEHLVVMNLWSLTYVDRRLRDDVALVLAEAARMRPMV